MSASLLRSRFRAGESLLPQRVGRANGKIALIAAVLFALACGVETMAIPTLGQSPDPRQVTGDHVPSKYP
jgi:hypothetical protein